jgi:catechol 2,3-dioxygenase-like lactoylglutathione lyase family enzyme
MKIGLVEVFVDDQNRARDFYTAMLGLDVKDDAPYGERGRWLTVASPEDRDGTELLLAPRNAAAEALHAARRETGTPAVSFTTDDCKQLPGTAPRWRRLPVRAPRDGLRRHRRRVRGRLRQPVQPAPARPRRTRRLSARHEERGIRREFAHRTCQSPDPTPSAQPLANLAYLGAVTLTIGMLTLGNGLLRAA